MAGRQRVRTFVLYSNQFSANYRLPLVLLFHAEVSLFSLISRAQVSDSLEAIADAQHAFEAT